MPEKRIRISHNASNSAKKGDTAVEALEWVEERFRQDLQDLQDRSLRLREAPFLQCNNLPYNEQHSTVSDPTGERSSR